MKIGGEKQIRHSREMLLRPFVHARRGALSDVFDYLYSSVTSTIYTDEGGTGKSAKITPAGLSI